MALTSGNNNLERRSGRVFMFGLAAGVAVYAGGLAILAAGVCRPGRTGQGADNTAKAADAATYKAVGVFKRDATGGSADGVVKVEVENDGIYLLKNSSSTDAIALSDVGNNCYIVDDETVAKTSANNTRAVAGVIKDVSSAGVWVRIGA